MGLASTASNSTSATLAETLEDASNVLLLSSPMSDEDSACADLLSIDAPDQEDVLSVTFTQSPDDRLAVWRTHVGAEMPARAGIISINDETRSAAAAGSGPSSMVAPVSISSVSDPGDLTGLGIEISEHLSDWRGDGNQIVVCFHSLTTLLQYADLQRVFQFLHVLSGRFSSVGAVAHYHMDPSAHDARTVNTLKMLMDAVVEVDEAGERTVMVG